MFIFLKYLLAFLTGLFTVWRVGRTRYYDEEKLVDISVFSTLLGVVAGWVVGVMGERWGTSFEIGDFLYRWRILWAGTVFWAFAIFYIRRLRWSLWPVLGFLWLGASAAGVFWMVAAAIFDLQFSIFSFGASLLTLMVSFCIVVRGGDKWLTKQKNNLKSKLGSWRSA